jgi:hypothetical protein
MGGSVSGFGTIIYRLRNLFAGHKHLDNEPAQSLTVKRVPVKLVLFCHFGNRGGQHREAERKLHQVAHGCPHSSGRGATIASPANAPMMPSSHWPCVMPKAANPMMNKPKK